ncbi:glycosyltransferase [Mycobacterium sp. C31M]
MKIALCGETYPPDINGAAIFSQRLAVGLAAKGHEMHVIAPSPSGESYREVRHGVIIHRIPSYRYPWHPTFRIADISRARAAVSEVLDEAVPDIIHIQAHFLVGRLSAIEAGRRNIPLVATNHFMPENLRWQLPVRVPNWMYGTIKSIAWRDLANVLRKADAVTVPTSHAVEVLREKTGETRGLAISCGVDLQRFRPKGADGHSAASTLLFVGRLDKEKHVDELIRVLPYLSAMQLRIVGSGSEGSRLKKLARSIDVDSRVHFIGTVEDADLGAEYTRADVFCMPGRVELQSIATLEAMSSGLPVVAVDSHALPLLVQQGVNGALYQPGDIGGLARAIKIVIASDSARLEMGKRSRSIARRHDLTNTICAFEALYANVLT